MAIENAYWFSLACGSTQGITGSGESDPAPGVDKLVVWDCPNPFDIFIIETAENLRKAGAARIPLRFPRDKKQKRAIKAIFNP